MDSSDERIETALREYLELACQAQRFDNIERGRKGILSLPRASVLARIEALAEPLLRTNDEWEWRRLLELYALLDSALLQRLARRAAEHSDPDIAAAGQDFLEPEDHESNT